MMERHTDNGRLNESFHLKKFYFGLPLTLIEGCNILQVPHKTEFRPSFGLRKAHYRTGQGLQTAQL